MQTGTATAATPNAGLVIDTLLGYERTAALRTAIELDVFRAIGEGAGTPAALAARCGTSERGMRILADYLCTIDLLSKQDDVYRHTPTSALFLDPASPASLHTTARFLGMSEFHMAAERLTEIVRNGRTVLPGTGSVEPENPIWVDFAHGMAPMMVPMCGPLAAIVLEGRKGPMKVLDIAAGHGLFGIEIAKQNPQAEVTAVDWAQVLDVAGANAQTAGVGARYHRLPGSAFEVDYGGPYDAVLLTNFLHHFDVPTCVSLLKKVRAALKPGGISATLDFVPNEDRVSPPMAAGFAMMMLMSTPAGDAYPLSEFESMHREAGFHTVAAHPLPESPHTVVTAVA